MTTSGALDNFLKFLNEMAHFERMVIRNNYLLVNHIEFYHSISKQNPN